MKLTSLHLFAGIGGCALGFQRAGFRPIAFADSHPHAQAVLKRHWPAAQHFGDVCGIKAADLVERPAVITGGFPCQDISYANRNATGITGRRSSLWFEQLRLIKELEPSYVLGENVVALRTRGLDVLLGSLAAIGYDAEWHCIPACYLGAWHKRDRIWILAYPSNGSQSRKGPILRQRHLSAPIRGMAPRWPGRSALASPRLCGHLDGVPEATQRLLRLGNSCYPAIPEMIGRAILEHERTKELLS